ncbi:MAG TPA: hypothetical protein VK582_13825 [Pyrinomonadaceae bacterium]|nr:hypothetical protein [Pyrinomonadaceae bacterium]
MRVKLSALLAILAGVVLFTPCAANGKAWRGIVPLHFTRADVERLLGPSNVEDSGYDIEGEQVRISYSSEGCQEGLPAGWKVRANTVVGISVSSKIEIKLTDVLIPGKNYDQIYRVHTPQMVDYVDVQEGVRYTTIDGAVQTTTYFGSEADDKKLRCGEHKYAAPVPAGAKNKFEQTPYDSYGRIPFEDAQARLDNFMFELENLNDAKPHYRGFIIVYAGRSAYPAESSTMAACSKDYLVRVRKADPEVVIATDGGYRNELTVELYIMPNDAYPPMLMPTVSPRNVEILPGALTPCSK